MINYNKLMKKLDDKGITTYVIRQKGLIPQSTLTKLKMCSGDSMDQIEKKLQEYKDNHNGKDFMCDVSTNTLLKSVIISHLPYIFICISATLCCRHNKLI